MAGAGTLRRGAGRSRFRPGQPRRRCRRRRCRPAARVPGTVPGTARGGLLRSFSSCALRASWRRCWRSAPGCSSSSSANAASPSASRRSRQVSTRCRAATSRRAATPSSSRASRIASRVSSSSRRICLARKASWRLRAPWAVIRRVCSRCGCRLSGIGNLPSWVGVRLASFSASSSTPSAWRRCWLRLGERNSPVSSSRPRMGRPGWSGAAKFTCNGAGGTPAQRWPPAEANAFRLLNHGYPRYEQ